MVLINKKKIRLKSLTMKNTDTFKMQMSHLQVHRGYSRVSDDQRHLLIDLLSQKNRQITIREASDMLQIKYESAKSIWQIYKKQGRKFNMKAQFFKTSVSDARTKRKYKKVPSHGSEDILLQFDRSCA